LVLPKEENPLGTWGTSHGNHWEPKVHHWEHDGNTRKNTYIYIYIYMPPNTVMKNRVAIVELIVPLLLMALFKLTLNTDLKLQIFIYVEKIILVPAGYHSIKFFKKST